MSQTCYIFKQNRNDGETWRCCLLFWCINGLENQRLEDDSFPFQKWSLFWIDIPSFSGVYPPEN